jgi:hypothetical protein
MPECPFHVGQVVRHKAAFLRSIQWSTDVPINGAIVSISDHPFGNSWLVRVQWCDQDEPRGILSCNLEPDPKCKGMIVTP